MDISATKEEGVDINTLLHKENAFYKLVLRIRSAFSKKNVEQLYNSDILSNAAKNLNKDRTPVVNFKYKQIDYGFYQKLVALKETATFFSEYMSLSPEEMGEYYVILVGVAAPDFANTVNRTTDPNTLDESMADDSKSRDKLIQVLDDSLKTMPDEVRSKLYQAVYQTQWFQKFVKLPFPQLISLFQKVSDGVYSCPFNICYDVFNQFVPILINQPVFGPQMFDALFDFCVSKNRIRNPQKLPKEVAKKQFIEKCLMLVNNITDFYSKDEILLIARIVNDETSWSPEKITFSDDWVAVLRSNWANNIYSQWTMWVQEIKKNKLKETVKSVFNLVEFPYLENRPWTILRSNIVFTKELTAGIIYWYIKNYYDESIAFFRRIQKEGDFISFGVKNQWAEGITLFDISSNNMLDLGFKLASNGKFGQVFQELATGKMQYFRAQTQIETLMAAIEKDVQQIVDTFLKACKILDFCMQGFKTYFDSKGIDSAQNGLRNFDTIGGQQHDEWVTKLNKMHTYMRNMVYLVSELLLIDGLKTGVIEE